MEKDELKALINREVTKQGRNIMGDGLAKILTALADAQQDYIIIDWDGLNKDNVSTERLAEIKAQLRAIKDANPLTILSVVMKNYDDIDGCFDMVTSVSGVILAFYSGSLREIVSLNFE